MKRDIGATILAGLLLAAPLASAQTCNPNMPRNRPDSRYTDNGDGTVTDKVTGLMWKQCTEGLSNSNNASPACDNGGGVLYTWDAAFAHVQSVNATGFAGHSDWRVPNVKELKSLTETACDSPPINTNLFPLTPPSGVWSSSPLAEFSYDAWAVDFISHGFDGWDNKYIPHAVRLVRTAQ